MVNSIGHLMESAQNFNFISIGINEIFVGIKNPKRFRVLILYVISVGIFTLINPFTTSNYFY